MVCLQHMQDYNQLGNLYPSNFIYSNGTYHLLDIIGNVFNFHMHENYMILIHNIKFKCINVQI